MVQKANDFSGIAKLLDMSRKQFYKWFHDALGTVVNQKLIIEDKNLI